MPLQSGSSKATISANIGEMVRSGMPAANAGAAAFKKAGKYRKPNGTTGKRPRLKEYIGGT